MKNKFKILSIDGGGIRGVFPAMFLTEFEENLKRNGVENWQVYQNFDLICGTSTGGILAIALSLGIPAREILKMYMENAEEIFGSKKSFIKTIWFSAHNKDNLERIIRDFFNSYGETGEDPRLKDCKIPVMIPIYDLIEGQASVLKSKYHPKFIRDYHIPAYQAAMATSAAPTYFNPYSSNYVDLNGTKKSFKNKIDGGVWANNPTLNAIIEAQKAFDKNLEDLALLSLGTGHQKFKDGGVKRNKGAYNWFLKKIKLKGKTGIRKKYGILYWVYSDGKKRIIDLFMQGQSQQTENLISLLQKGIDKQEPDNFYYTRINTELDESSAIELDETNKEKLEILTEKASREFQKRGKEILEVFGKY